MYSAYLISCEGEIVLIIFDSISGSDCAEIGSGACGLFSAGERVGLGTSLISECPLG